MLARCAIPHRSCFCRSVGLVGSGETKECLRKNRDIAQKRGGGDFTLMSVRMGYVIFYIISHHVLAIDRFHVWSQ
jgi:hypothetical protein